MGNKNVISFFNIKEVNSPCEFLSRKQFISKRRRLLKLIIFIKWHLIQSNFMGQIGFQLSNTLMLATVLHKKRRDGVTEYNQS